MQISVLNTNTLAETVVSVVRNICVRVFTVKSNRVKSEQVLLTCICVCV